MQPFIYSDQSTVVLIKLSKNYQSSFGDQSPKAITLSVFHCTLFVLLDKYYQKIGSYLVVQQKKGFII